MVDIILYSGGLPVDGRTRLQLLFLFYLLFQQQNALSTVFLLQATPSLFYLITEAYPPHSIYFFSSPVKLIFFMAWSTRGVMSRPMVKLYFNSILVLQWVNYIMPLVL